MQIKGDGSIVKMEKKDRSKCRHWKLKIRTDRGVKEKRFTGSYTEAKAALAQYKASLVIPQGEMLFSDYARKWLQLRERSGEFREKTLEKDRNLIERLCEAFPNISLGELTPSIIREGLLDLKEERGFGNTHLNALHVKLKSILESAVDDGEIPSNPMRKLRAPKRDIPSRNALPEETLWRFLRALKELPLDSHTIGVRLAVLAGLRRGETCGLQWGDIENGVAHIRRTVFDSGKVSETTKTLAGIRYIPLPDMLQCDLKTWKKIQRERLLVLGIKQKSETPVLTSDVGTRLNPQNLDRWWRNNRDSFGLSGVVIHELRHTYATVLANHGAPSQVLKSVLGWSSIEMADTYVHDDENQKQKIIRQFSDFIEQGVTSGVTSNGTSEDVRKVS